MRILLLGDYSNVHATLARSLRELGHDVVLVSDGDTWKNYPRDIDLVRRRSGFLGGLLHYMRMWRIFLSLRGFDVVQLVNPVFAPLRAERLLPFYRLLRRRNKRVFLAAFGMDHYYAQACLDCHTFRYSDFNFGTEVRDTCETRVWRKEWVDGAKGRLNRIIADDCDGIISGLYEYDAAYRPHFSGKLHFIPFPIVPKAPRCVKMTGDVGKLRFFIGIQRSRSAYKGTDVMLRALERVVARYPSACEIVRVESLPFNQYVRTMEGCHVLLDQLYSYTPAMNALEAMSRGLVVVGGGEPENYEILGCADLRPIINVQPSADDVYNQLCRLVEHRDEVPALAKQSYEYIARYHDYRKVAARYLSVWTGRD